MTDMKISDEAREVIAKALCCPGGRCALAAMDRPCSIYGTYTKYDFTTRNGAENLDALASAFCRHYAAHPEELPQEVVDAVLRQESARRQETLEKSAVASPPIADLGLWSYVKPAECT